ISSQLKRLEKDFGLRLLWQSGRESRLTDAGETLVSFARQIVGLCEEILVVMDEYQSGNRGHLRVAATTTPGVYILPPIIGRFNADNPNIDVEFTIGNYTQVVK